MDCNLHRRWATSPALDRNNLISAIIGNIRPSSPLALILPLPQSHPGTSSFPQRFFLPDPPYPPEGAGIRRFAGQKEPVPEFGDLPVALCCLLAAAPRFNVLLLRCRHHSVGVPHHPLVLADTAVDQDSSLSLGIATRPR